MALAVPQSAKNQGGFGPCKCFLKFSGTLLCVPLVKEVEFWPPQ
jgi:hypothetical protein